MTLRLSCRLLPLNLRAALWAVSFSRLLIQLNRRGVSRMRAPLFAVGCLPLLGRRLCIPYINGTAPFAIGFPTPDRDRTPLGRNWRTVLRVHRHRIPAEHIRELSIRRERDIFRLPSNPESGYLHTALDILTQRDLADDRREAGRDNDGILRPVRENALNVAPLGGHLRPLGVAPEQAIFLRG